MAVDRRRVRPPQPPTTPDGAPSSRSYGQACPVARAMDLLGERWTMLVVRELLVGPRRFGDLTRVLAAAGPNRVSARLHRLESAGVVHRDGSGAWALTPSGEGLRGPATDLALWGLRLMSAADVAGARPVTVVLCLAGAVPPHRLEGLDLDVEVRSGETFTVGVHDGRLTLRPGACPGASALTCEPATFLALVLGGTTVTRARREGVAEVSGSTAPLTALLAAVGPTARSLVPAT